MAIKHLRSANNLITDENQRIEDERRRSDVKGFNYIDYIVKVNKLIIL